MEKIENKIKSYLERISTITYPQGATGIGATVEYLIQNGYFEGDSDDIPGVFDDRLFSLQNLPRRSKDEIVSLQKALSFNFLKHFLL